MSGSEANLYLCFAFVFIYLYCLGDPFIKGERIGIPLTGSGRKGFVQSQAKCPSSCVVVFLCSMWICGEGDCCFEARVIVVFVLLILVLFVDNHC